MSLHAHVAEFERCKREAGTFRRIAFVVVGVLVVARLIPVLIP